MKIKSFFSIIVITLLTTNVSFAQDNSNTTSTTAPIKITTAVVGIDGMVCQEGCADKISENLKSTEGVTSAKVSFKKKEAVIRYDPSLTSISDLKSIITNTKVKEYAYLINSVIIKK
ncbi:heavy-metal-associated domain-containing protein [Maribacter sp. ACAM166]|uniref:heavy-metal-associated domain-containing protein n=1 Tax=Maribacter sp. ACAM166 TaxID=2508996 RepID=UPI00148525A1|nr:heavy metal-associated domain-containing protein [Maribacter sp. ACAM166]